MSIPLLTQLSQATARPLYRSSFGLRRKLWLKLAKMEKNQVPVLEAITDLHSRRVDSHGENHPEAVALAEWILAMQNGVRFGQAIKGWVSPVEQMRIAAGDAAGELGDALVGTAFAMQASRRIQSAIVKGTFYPMVLCILAFLVLYVSGFKLVPMFSATVGVDQWRGMAKVMVTISLWARDWLWLAAIVFASLGIFYFTSLSWFDGRIRIWLDRHMPYSVYRITQGTNWMLALAALQQAQIPMMNALEDLKKVANPWLSARIEACIAGIRAGYNLGESLHRSEYGFPDKEIILDLRTYASVSGLEEALQSVAEEWIDETVEQIQSRMAFVFGLSIIAVSMLVAVMAGGLMAMQAQMSQVINGGFR
jgi:type II secretory pathway component PulF